jgi:3-methyladenine DNA glycosylase AlkC
MKRPERKISNNKRSLLKDIYFNHNKIDKLADEILLVYKDFDSVNFIKETVSEFPRLELKQRIFHITNMLYKYLPTNYLEAIKIIEKALPKELNNDLSDGDYGDFIYAPYSEYVALYGLEKRYLKESLQLLEKITKRFSAEFAIRHFWNNHQKITYKHFLKWSKNKNYHVRRLASEGSRPRLPWGKNISLDYRETEIFLDNLFYDKTRYVTRSVANHLNDISKFDPDFVLQKLSAWERSHKQNKKEMTYIRKHATRTLRKRKTI